MAIEQKVKAVLQSAELVFELAIIEPTRYGPIIHANVPDYAEILMKIFIEEAGRSTTKKIKYKGKDIDKGLSFYELKQDITCNPGGIDSARFQNISEYFNTIREQFRNPLHHTDKVQGYVIAKPVALECLIAFDDLLWVLFPAITPSTFDTMNYPCYMKFIEMEYNQSFGKVPPRYYRAIISALQRLEDENAFRCPSDFDTSRLIAIRHLYHLDIDGFIRQVFNYRPQIKGLIIDELHQSRQAYSSNQLLGRLKRFPNNHDLTVEEIERCLTFMEGERIDGYGVITSVRGRTSAGNPIVRYSFAV